MNPVPESALAAEARARVLIDAQLEAAGWSVQDTKQLNLSVGPGVARREAIMAAGHGRADYLLYLDKRVVGVIEAKPVGTPLSGVEWQSAMYATGLPPEVRLSVVTKDGRLPFVFEASGTETHFTNGFDPEPRSRRVFGFPRPEALARTLRDAEEDEANPTWRGKVRHLPALKIDGLRPAQVTAIKAVESSLAEQRFDRSLVQMATGAGKTYTAVTLAYRLLKYGGFRRVLFLVDRNNLGEQTRNEFRAYRTPDDGRLFTEVHNVDMLTSAGLLGSSQVVISTIQRVFKALRNEEVTAEDDPTLDDFVPEAPVTVAYNPEMPPETFDLVIVDEAHRSIYGVWRGVLEYFDAHIVGLTATPGKQTFAFFQQNLVSEYTYPQSVADRVNVDFDLYRIRTQISEQGATIEAGTIVPKVDRRTRVQRLEALDEALEYTDKQLDRAVTATDQIRTVLETFRDRLFTEIFPGRSTVPKTLIFAKDDAHAEEIVTQLRQVFGKGNDFAAKITYAARDPKGQLQAFRTSPTLRIAVTVDMIATGTDVKPLECVFFMRDVRSAQYFEQMKGRGARTIDAATFQAVTPDATEKTRFVIVDAIGVTEHDFVEPPLNRDKGISLEKLLGKAATYTLSEDETATLASRLAALELQLTRAERDELDAVAGQPVKAIVRALVDAVDPDHQTERPGRDEPCARRRVTGREGRHPATPRCRGRAARQQARTAQPHPRTPSCPRPGDRRGERRLPHRGLRCGGPRPCPQRHRVVARLPRRTPRRDHRDPDHRRGSPAALVDRRLPAPRRVRRHPGAGRADQPPAAQLDSRPALVGVRSGGRGTGTTQPAPHAHRPCQPPAVHCRRGLRTRALRRNRAQAVHRVARPAGASRDTFHHRPALVAGQDGRGDRRVRRHLHRRSRRGSLRRARGSGRRPA